MAGQANIEIGQRYRDTRPTMFGKPSRTVWVVDALWHGLDGLLYAEVIQEKDPGRKKTISTNALADPRFYRPVAEQPQDRVLTSPNQG